MPSQAHRHLEAWDVRAGMYPYDGALVDQLTFLLRYAVLAPSSHNTQPWLFRVDDGGIELYADRTRSLDVIDPHYRQLLMSCGAALFNLRVAMAHFGGNPVVEIYPSKRDEDLVARVVPGGRVEPTLELVRLFDVIPHRHTNRQPFEVRPLSYQIADELISAVSAEGSWMVRLHPERKHAAASLIAAADRVQFKDRHFRRELSEWLVSDQSSRGDGIPGYAKSYGAPISAANTLLVRTFDVGGSVASTEQQLAEGSPMLAVLGTASDDERAWVAAGQAMQRALLTGHVHGVSASFLNQALELDDFRPRFTEIAGRSGFPQLVLRFGYGAPAEATPRRPLGDVLLSRSEESPSASAAGS